MVFALEKIVRQSLLYDFYGELLTEHQKNIYEDVIVNDLSYSEIARLTGISRQGVYDMMKRCDKILEDYEAKLKLVERFMAAKDKAREMRETLRLLKERNKDGDLEELIACMDTKTAELLDHF